MPYDPLAPTIKARDGAHFGMWLGGFFAVTTLAIQTASQDGKFWAVFMTGSLATGSAFYRVRGTHP